MICPQHDTHIDNCGSESHDVSDNWVITIPMRCSTEEILKLAMTIRRELNLQLHETSPWREGMVPVNINVQERG